MMGHLPRDRSFFSREFPGKIAMMGG